MENNNASYPSAGARSYEHVFIDLDDTLWDFHANARESLHDVFIEQDLTRWFADFDHFFRIYAKRNLELWDLYGKGVITKEYLQAERFRHPLKQMGVENNELAARIGTRFLEILPDKSNLLPHAIEILDYLKSRYALTIISNGFIEVQYKKLRNTKLDQYFGHIVLSEAAGALKPSRQIFDYALELNKTQAEDAIMIGDSYEADIIGAQNAGIDQIYLSQTPTPDQSATYTIHCLNEIKQIL